LLEVKRKKAGPSQFGAKRRRQDRPRLERKEEGRTVPVWSEKKKAGPSLFGAKRKKAGPSLF